MSLIDVIHDHVVQPANVRPLRAFARWVADRRVGRQRRVALQSLLLAPEHLLRDLGISHDELIRAIERRH